MNMCKRQLGLGQICILCSRACCVLDESQRKQNVGIIVYKQYIQNFIILRGLHSLLICLFILFFIFTDKLFSHILISINQDSFYSACKKKFVRQTATDVGHNLLQNLSMLSMRLSENIEKGKENKTKGSQYQIKKRKPCM